MSGKVINYGSGKKLKKKVHHQKRYTLVLYYSVEEYFCEKNDFNFKIPKQLPTPTNMYWEKELSQRLILVERIYFSLPAIYCYIILTMSTVPLILQIPGIGSEKQNKK